MVTAEEFLSQYGREDSQLEFKSAQNGIPRDFWETYSAFANTKGGTIVLGISDDQVKRQYHVEGIGDTDRYLKILWDTLNNPSKVNANLLSNDDVWIEDIEGKDVIVITIPAADRRIKPVYLNGNMDTHTFKRGHEGDYRCRVDEVRSMVRDSYDTSSDADVIGEISGCDWISMEDANLFISMLKNTEHSNDWTEQSKTDLLAMTGALVTDNDAVHPTRAGLMMFGKIPYILRHVPNFHLDYRESFGNNRWDYRLNSDDLNGDVNIFCFVRSIISRLPQKIGVPFKLNGFVRDGNSVTLQVIREALLNAVINADYLASGGVTVVYDGKRVTITNPGSMRIPLEKAVRGGYSDPRNRNIMRMFLLLNMVEDIGSGINFMYRSKEEGAVLNVDMSEEYSPLRVIATVDLPPLGIKPNQNESMVLRYVSENPNASMKEISESTGIPSRTLTRIVSELTSRGVLQRSGTYRNTVWSVRR